jgi:hypothetical protein
LKATAYKRKSPSIHKALAMGFHSDIPLANFMTFERAPLAIAGKLNKEKPPPHLNSYTPNTFYTVRSDISEMPRTVAPWEIKRELLMKADGQTDRNLGREPEARSADELLNYGVINLDKQAGPSSHEVAAWVKRILKQEKVGHGGTLEATA